ncbi:MAG: AmmeMemoRadiSam system protein B [Crenarchaeota archaeon]|nr:AmmeMemoRadiSam system protein B [Thermoproteota archaeon]
MKIREPAVAGAFYEGTREGLIRQIEWCIMHPLGPGTTRKEKEPDVTAVPIVISPHAGYIFSGPIAAHSYVELNTYERPRTVIIAGPNHYGIGAPVAIMVEGVWRTPLGEVEIDTEIARELMRYCKILEPDWYAFMREHSLEVQLPFLQYFYNNSFKIVPICMFYQGIDAAEELGRAIARVISAREPGEIVYVASTDWNHYEPHEVTVKKDLKAIERVLELDLKGFYRVISEYSISVCGYGPVGASIVAARELGVKKVRLLKHATSGDVIKVYPELYGDLVYSDEVVGYASIAFYL